MPKFVVEKIQAALNDRAKSVRGSRIHVAGVAYKKDVADVRESPAVDIIAFLERLGALVSYSDPHVARLDVASGTLVSQDLDLAAAESDCVVIITNHSGVDYGRLVEIAALVIDTRNCLKGNSSPKIVRL
jgi:UDP-N-acetyl-D-glucosamine dehydrogenase